MTETRTCAVRAQNPAYRACKPKEGVRSQGRRPLFSVRSSDTARTPVPAAPPPASFRTPHGNGSTGPQFPNGHLPTAAAPVHGSRSQRPCHLRVSPPLRRPLCARNPKERNIRLRASLRLATDAPRGRCNGTERHRNRYRPFRTVPLPPAATSVRFDDGPGNGSNPQTHPWPCATMRTDPYPAWRVARYSEGETPSYCLK